MNNNEDIKEAINSDEKSPEDSSSTPRMPLRYWFGFGRSFQDGGNSACIDAKLASIKANLDRGSDAVRQNALITLGNLNVPEDRMGKALELIAAALWFSPSRLVRQEVFIALGKLNALGKLDFPGPFDLMGKVLLSIKTGLSDSDSRVRSSATRALGKLNSNRNINRNDSDNASPPSISPK